MFYKLSKQQIENYKKGDCFILAIESSCDETSVAIIKNGTDIICNLIASQIEIHKRFGGVVPEVASRNHLMAINNLIDEALTIFGGYLKANNIECIEKNNQSKQNENKNNKIDKSPKNENAKKALSAIAVTYGSGLAGALMVGITAAKTLAMVLDLPLIAVDHIKGHMASACLNFVDEKAKLKNLNNENEKQQFEIRGINPNGKNIFALVTSGGHTEINKIINFNKFDRLVLTTDDAIGECFDKVARVLNLPYPGGPEVERAAKKWMDENATFESLNNTENPKENKELNNQDISKKTGEKKLINDNINLKLFNYTLPALTQKFFSYSGLKAAVINYCNSKRQKNEEINIGETAATFQKLAFMQVVNKTIAIIKKESKGFNFEKPEKQSINKPKLILCGGVAANNYFKQTLKAECEKNNIEFVQIPFALCGDNAAMIGAMGYFNLINNINISDLTLTTDLSL
jgi:N6-L-threonylcarbamoyladenine synthase